MKIRSNYLHQTGDTIVEVLIATAIVSSVIVGAFAVSQKSASAVRTSQERSEMTQILQGQVELVRAAALQESDATAGVYETAPGGAAYFCMEAADISSPSYGKRQDFTNGFSTLPSLDSDNFSSYPNACKNISGLYNIAVTYDKPADMFRFNGRWDGIGGGKNQVQFVYRIHPGKAALAAGAAAINGQTSLASLPSPLGPSCYESKIAQGLPTYPECYTIELLNTSVNPPGVIQRCTMDWGDGTGIKTFPSSDVQCQSGNRIGPHQYPNVGTAAVKQPYTTTLTNYFNGAAPKSYDSTVYLPR